MLSAQRSWKAVLRSTKMRLREIPERTSEDDDRIAFCRSTYSACCAAYHFNPYQLPQLPIIA